VDGSSSRYNILVIIVLLLDHHDHKKFQFTKHSMFSLRECVIHLFPALRADHSHEDGDDDGPEADEEERKAIFSIRNTLGVTSYLTHLCVNSFSFTVRTPPRAAAEPFIIPSANEQPSKKNALL